jgi:hypothetical protein
LGYIYIYIYIHTHTHIYIEFAYLKKFIPQETQNNCPLILSIKITINISDTEMHINFN